MIYSEKWIQRYLNLAKHIATWSKDPSTQVGAVIIGDKGELRAQGYNGFPRGVDDSDERYSDREQKYPLMVHAELNCIYHAARIGLSLYGTTMFIDGLPPCCECTKGIIQAGISSIHIRPKTDDLNIWWKAFETSKKMLDEVGITYTMYS